MKKDSFFAWLRSKFSRSSDRFVLTLASQAVLAKYSSSQVFRNINSWPALTGLDSTPLALAERGKPNLGYKDTILVRFNNSNYCQWIGKAPLGEKVRIGRVMEICKVAN